MRLGSLTRSVTDGLEITDSRVGRFARSVSVKNDSGCYALISFGSNYVPRTTLSAQKILWPHSSITRPIYDGAIGIYMVASPDSPEFPPSAPPGGTITVEWFDTPAVETEHIGPGSFSTDTRSAVLDTYPYGITGLSHTYTGLDPNPYSFTQIDAVGWQAIRLYLQYTATTDPAQGIFYCTQLVTSGVLTRTETFRQLFANGIGGIIDIPLKYTTIVAGNVVTPQFVGAVGDTLAVTPVLLMGGIQYNNSFKM